MNNATLEIKLGFITGLRSIVVNEVGLYPDLHVRKGEDEFIYLHFPSRLSNVLRLRSVLRAYIVSQNPRYNPGYISRHKSLLGEILTKIIQGSKYTFRTYKLVCAGTDSPSARSIAKYIQDTFKLTEAEDADLKVHIIKTVDTWEIGAQITPRPLSLREYKVRNMGGAMDPTIAYAANSLCGLEHADSYLNVFSGSATLLIEAAQCYPRLKKLIGFDNNKDTITLAIQNIRKAGVIRRVQLKHKDIFDKPDLGKFDAIASDLPFGMTISKDEDLGQLYRCFIEYCQEALNQKGTLAVYTSEHKKLEEIISKSNFEIIETVELRLFTSANAYLRPKIFACRLK